MPPGQARVPDRAQPLDLVLRCVAGRSPTIWAWTQITEYLKIAGQPVTGPWPPHQEPRPDPEEESLPVAVAEPKAPIERDWPRL